MSEKEIGASKETTKYATIEPTSFLTSDQIQLRDFRSKMKN